MRQDVLSEQAAEEEARHLVGGFGRIVRGVGEQGDDEGAGFGGVGRNVGEEELVVVVVVVAAEVVRRKRGGVREVGRDEGEVRSGDEMVEGWGRGGEKVDAGKEEEGEGRGRKV